MKILVTGAKGFVGRNLCLELKNIKDGKARCWGDVAIDEVYEYDIDSAAEELEAACRECDFVFNLAGVNRPQNSEEFMQGNFGFASTLLDTLKKYGNKCPVMISSSIQAALDNPYGESKRAGEQLMFAYSKETGAKVLAYRFPNLFGKWCRPNYNSAVATFCHNKANDLPIQVNNPATELTLVYIDDLVAEMIAALKGEEHREGEFCKVPVEHKATLGEIVDLLDSFKAMPQTLMIPEIPQNSFAKKLYSTYLSYLPKDKAIFDLKMSGDGRGSFTELIHTPKCGQVSICISKPGITRGEHWHHTKWEQFIVVKGHGLIQMRPETPVRTDASDSRNVRNDDIIEFEVSGDKIQSVIMLPGYTHNIINLSDTEDLVTVMYSNEIFDPQRPDTYADPVK